MTEIKLNLGDHFSPEWLAANLRERAAYMGEDRGAEDTAAKLHELADSIEEQVKPAIEEPTEWGSVVRARRVGYGAEDTTSLRWWRQNTRDANDSWASEPAGDLGVRYSSHWSYLHDPEVLRVGVGDEAAYNNGVSDTVSALIARLLEKRHGTNLMQKRDAFTEAIKIAEAL